MSYFKKTASELQFDDAVLSLAIISKTEIENEYRNQHSKKFFLKILNELVKSIKAGDLKIFISLSSLIKQLTQTENQETLKELLTNNLCPLKNTNLIILCCKFNCSEILSQILMQDREIIENLSVNIGCDLIDPFDRDENLKNCFYYSIRSNNVDIVRLIIEYWPKKIENKLLDQLLSDACRELILVQNVFISDEMKCYVETKLLDIRFYENVKKLSKPKKSFQVATAEIKERSDFIIENMKKICFYEKDMSCEEFIFILKMLVGNFQILKTELKSTYDHLPWEEMQFFLVIYIKSLYDTAENSFFYRSILTKEILIMYMLEFLQNFREIADDLRSFQGRKISNREQMVRRISSSSVIFEEMYKTYEQIRDFYSLDRIKYYIDVVLNNKLEDKNFEFLLIERCLHVIGENIKNTFDSPNMSNEMREKLSNMFTKDMIEIMSKLRNILSKPESLLYRLNMKKDNEYSQDITRFKSDLGKIRDFVATIFYSRKFNVILNAIHKIINTNSISEFGEVCKIFNWGNLNIDSVLHEDRTIVLAEPIEARKFFYDRKNTKFRSKVSTAIYNSLDEFEQNKIFKLQRYHKLLSLITDIAKTEVISERGLNSVKLKLKVEITEQESNYGDFSIIRSLTLNEHNLKTKERLQMFGKMKNLRYPQMKSTESLEGLSVFFPEFTRNQSVRRNDVNNIVFREKVKVLELIIEENELLEQDMPRNLLRFLHNPKNQNKKVAIEMLLLDFLNYYFDKSNDNFYMYDQSYPILTGRELRNFIAHGSFLIDVMPFNVNLAIIVNAIKFLGYYKKSVNYNSNNNVNILEFTKFKATFEQDLQKIEIKIKSFAKIVENGCDFEELNSSRIDFHCRNWLNYNLPEIAVKNGNLKDVQYLLDNFVTFDLASAKNLSRSNLLHLCTANSNVEIFNFIIENFINSKDHIFTKDVNNLTTLHYAVESGSLKMLKTVLKYCTKFDIVSSAAIESAESVEIFQVLFQYEDEIDCRGLMGRNYTLLGHFSERGLIEIVKFLVNHGAYVNFVNHEGTTALHCASKAGHAEIVEYLIQNDADINAIEMGGLTPIDYAILMSDEKVFKVLLKNNADINLQRYSDNMGILEIAFQKSNIEICGDIIKHSIGAEFVSLIDNTPLHYAVASNTIEIVEILLKYDININAKNIFNETPLHWAKKNVEIFEILLKNGANVKVKDFNDETPLEAALTITNANDESRLLNIIKTYDLKPTIDMLYIASERNKPKIFEYCYEKLQESVEKIEENAKHQSFAIASRYGSLEICKYLITDSEIKERINRRAIIHYRSYYTALRSAAEKGHLDIAKFLLENGANPNARTDVMKKHLLKCKTPNLAMIKLLIENGYKIRSTKIFIYALNTNNIEIIEYLIAKGVDINGIGRFESPIFHAIIGGNEKVLKILLNHPRFLCNCRNKEMETPLHCAVREHMIKLTRRLIDRGCDLNLKDVRSKTPLHIAVKHNSELIVKILIEKCAEINPVDNEGSTPLHLATTQGNYDVVRTLIESGATLNHANVYGFTALHLAIAYNVQNIYEILIENGASKDIKFCNLYDIVDLAVIYGNLNFLKLFLEENLPDFKKEKLANENLLHLAVLSEDNFDLIKILIAEGAEINKMDEFGDTPLHVAAKRSSKDMCKFLLHHGAKFNPSNYSGSTPYDVANGNTKNYLKTYDLLYSSVKNQDIKQVVEILTGCDYKISTDVLDFHGKTLIYYAVISENSNTVEELLKTEPNINFINDDGKSILHKAVELGNYDIVILLLSNGAIFSSVDITKISTDLDNEVKYKKILKLFEFVSQCFNFIEKNDNLILTELTALKNFDEIKSVLIFTKDSSGATILQRASELEINFLNDLERVLLYNHYEKLDNAEKLYCESQFVQSNAMLEQVLKDFTKIFTSNDVKVFKIELRLLKNFEKRGKLEIALKMAKELLEKIKLYCIQETNLMLDTEMFIMYIENILEVNNQSIDEFQSKLDKFSFAIDKSQIILLKINYYWSLCKLGKFMEAKVIQKDIFTIYKNLYKYIEDPECLKILNKVAEMFHVNLNYCESLDIYKFVYQQQLERFGPKHVDTLMTKNEVLFELIYRKNYKQALEEYQTHYELQLKLFGENHYNTVICKFYIGLTKYLQKDFQQCWEIFSDVSTKNNNFLDFNKNALIASICECKNDIRNSIDGRPRYQCEKDFHPDANPLTDEQITYFKKELFYWLKKGNNLEVWDIIKLIRNLSNAIDETSRTPLHYAAQYCDKFIVRILIKDGADIFAKTSDGETALHIAVQHNRYDICKALINLFAEYEFENLYLFLNAQTLDTGNTALHITVEQDNYETFLHLIKNGAIHNIRNKNFDTPKDIAKNPKIQNILTKLENYHQQGNRSENDYQEFLDKIDEISCFNIFLIKKIIRSFIHLILVGFIVIFVHNLNIETL